MGILHLTKRFFGSLSKAPPSPDDAAWVESQLLPGERDLWARMTAADQRHACMVARRTVQLLGDGTTRPVVAAALLHDVGKIETPINTFERVLATMAGSQASRSQIDQWSTEKGWLGRAGRYMLHNEIGARLLEEAGSDPLTVAWAREHELKHTEWTLPEEISTALWKADNI